jgi:hypothetical protein
VRFEKRTPGGKPLRSWRWHATIVGEGSCEGNEGAVSLHMQQP